MLDINIFWRWEKAAEGMAVYVVDNEDKDAELMEGTITEVCRKTRMLLRDGKYVCNSKVAYVVVTIEGGQKIKLRKNSFHKRYQILLR